MDIEKQVATLEQSKRLKELGVEIDTEHRWGLWNGRMQVLCPPEYEILSSPTIKAPTTEEIADLLPSDNWTYYFRRYSKTGKIMLTFNYAEDEEKVFLAISLTQALASMLIWLIENNHIK